MVKTDQKLPYHGDVVGTSGKSARQETLHLWSDERNHKWGEDLAVNQTTYSMDSAHWPGPYTTGLDNKTPVPAMATSATPGGVIDTSPNGVVQN